MDYLCPYIRTHTYVRLLFKIVLSSFFVQAAHFQKMIFLLFRSVFTSSAAELAAAEAPDQIFCMLEKKENEKLSLD